VSDFSTVNRDEIAQLLSGRGVFPTAQRIDVALVILAKPQHLSAEQIIAGIRAMGSRVSKATVYNTLNLFCERGLVRTVEVDPARQYYDSTITAHHHFYNVDTGELTDIPIDAVALNVSTALPPGTEQAGVDVVIRVRGGKRR
jgi:Fur family transcriptional regulator, iron response regulator